MHRLSVTRLTSVCHSLLTLPLKMSRSNKIPDHHEHLWACSWRRQSPCWPDQRRPPWRPARKTSYGLGRSPVHQIRYIHHDKCIITIKPRDQISTHTSTVRWAIMALWWPSSVSSAMWAISASDLPINIWQAVANISLFWPWIFTWRR